MNPPADSRFAPTSSQRRTAAVAALMVAALLAWRWWHNPVSIPDPLSAELQLQLQDRLDPNTASPDALAELPGVGPKLAAQIVAHRQQYAREHPDQLAFRSLDDLDNVKGIGPAMLQNLRPYLSFPSP